jgi:hypothetical protein
MILLLPLLGVKLEQIFAFRLVSQIGVLICALSIGSSKLLQSLALSLDVLIVFGESRIFQDSSGVGNVAWACGVQTGGLGSYTRL